MAFLSTLITAVLITALSIPLLRSLALRHNLVDMPGGRKIHAVPIPRIGGVAMGLGAFVPLLYWLWNEPFLQAYLLAAAVLVVFGLADDLRDIAPRWKLFGQVIAAALVMQLGGVRIAALGTLLPDGATLPLWISLPLTLIVIVGITNAINLSDGLDGLAGGISLLGLAAIAFLSWQEGDNTIGLIAVALCGAIFGFLRYNTYPATIFMGDTGSQLLGFSAAVLSLSLTQGNTPLSPVMPLLLIGFPVLDTLTVMVGRIRRGHSPFSADKTHFHHSLLELRLHQTESVLVIYMIQVGLIIVAYCFRFHADALLLGGYLLFSTGVLLLFNWSRRLNARPKRSRLLTRSKLFLRNVRDKTSIISYAFRALCLLYPALVVLVTLLAGDPTGSVSLAALLCFGLLLASWYLRPDNAGNLLRVMIYLLIPYSVYHSELWLSGQTAGIIWGYRLLFCLLVLLNLLVSKLTRRRNGFKSTPLDSLIFIMALAMLLPATQSQDYRTGLMAAKIIILYYGCEVLLAEIRGRPTVLAGGMLVALGVLALRGVL